MMKSKKVRILSLFLSIALIAASILVYASASEPVAQTTFLDFEEGSNPFNAVNKTNGALAPVDATTIVTEASGNKVFNLTHDGAQSAINEVTPYGSGYQAYGVGLSEESWVAGTRPTKVQFAFKAGSLTQAAKQNCIMMFHPLQTNGWGYYGCRIGVQVNSKNEQGTVYFNTDDWVLNGQFTRAAAEPGASSGKLPFDRNTAPDDAAWFTFTCEYDWSKYTEADGWQVSFACELTDGMNVSRYTETVKYRDPVNTEGVTGSDPAVNADTTYTVGIQGVKDGNHFLYVDDMRIWSENIADPTTTYAPIPQVKALGALAVEDEQTESIKVRASFDLRMAAQIAQSNGEVITAYGALAVAGTKNGTEMRNALDSALEGTVPEGFKFLKNGVNRSADLPDVYSVTVNNSGTAENMGKRMSAVAYIVTNKGTYVSRNYNDAMGVADGVVNKSVVGLLKDAFTTRYLTAAYSDNLTQALLDYNAVNSTSYQPSDIAAIVNKTGATTESEKALLSSIYALVKNTAPGGDEVFPGNW